jgi:hypothetical protein
MGLPRSPIRIGRGMPVGVGGGIEMTWWLGGYAMRTLRIPWGISDAALTVGGIWAFWTG